MANILTVDKMRTLLLLLLILFTVDVLVEFEHEMMKHS